MSSVNKAIELYDAGFSIPEVSQATGVSRSTVRLRVKEAGKLRSRADGVRLALKGKQSPLKGRSRPPFSEDWKSNISKAKLALGEANAIGTSVKPNGYIEYTRGPHKGRLVHAVTMEDRLGRTLRGDECVHHIDGDKSNNNDNNLALVTRSGHSRLHRFEDALAGKIRERKSNGRFG